MEFKSKEFGVKSWIVSFICIWSIFILKVDASDLLGAKCFRDDRASDGIYTSLELKKEAGLETFQFQLEKKFWNFNSAKEGFELKTLVTGLRCKSDGQLVDCRKVERAPSGDAQETLVLFKKVQLFEEVDPDADLLGFQVSPSRFIEVEWVNRSTLDLFESGIASRLWRFQLGFDPSIEFCEILMAP